MKFLLPLIAIIFIAAGVFAMKANKQVKNLEIKTWDYNGSSGDEDVAANYSLGVDGSPTHSTCGQSQVTICQIQAEPDPSDNTKPNLNGENPMDHQTDFQATLRADE